jgi:hypothetical protein
MRSQTTRPAVPRSPDATRSKVTNGKRLFADMTVDGRSVWSRRFRDVMDLHITDLGGTDVVSTAEQSICRRIATLTTELELLELRFAQSGKGASAEDLDLYARISNSLDRKLQTIGLKRVARDVTPTLRDYLNDQNNDQKPTVIEDAEAAE